MTPTIKITNEQKRALAHNNPWPVIQAIDWGKQNRSKELQLDRLQYQITKQLTAKENEQIVALCNRLYRDLKEAADKAKVEHGLSDDGESDLICHVIGLGKAEYEANLKNPKLLAKRTARLAFRENFLYVFQREDVPITFYSLQTALKKEVITLTNYYAEPTDHNTGAFYRIADQSRKIALKLADGDWSVNEKERAVLGGLSTSNSVCLANIYNDIRNVGNLILRDTKKKVYEPIPRVARLFLKNREQAIVQLSALLVNLAKCDRKLGLQTVYEVSNAIRTQKGRNKPYTGEPDEIAVEILSGARILTPWRIPSAAIAYLLLESNPQHPLVEFIDGNAGTSQENII